ncbi:hypothetical protein CEUSTIGMA_g2944.t1 [Chlamydomonas eustigma]|uniref:ribose-5-phosphate isomerase n=1 Tax=Chlamydomonas eustigma TaxID=1157962 RepID=A0A250WXF6_9CHLO|nr:hypothetical protein CEUSTIGMA_g2944.t1 [Chlamydomonas eustigma]|eukprot:GAX75501.1 hypothetical protein CEUSTIGMA_g2944.t1 [Chlamydomonas eustigma]
MLGFKNSLFSQSLSRGCVARPARKTRLRCQAINDLPTYKREAAKLLVDKFITSSSTLGLGSGELVNLVIAEVGERLASGQLQSIKAVPSCNAAASSAAFHGVPLCTLDQLGKKVDVAFEEVDMIDMSQNAAVKGVNALPQQPQILALRELAEQSSKYVLLVEADQVVDRLHGTLPLVIEGGEDWEEPAEELDDIFLGDAELWRRPMAGTANPRGGDNPYVSPEGHNIVDVRFEGSFKLFGEEQTYQSIVEEINGVQGLISHGLLLNMADAVIVASKITEPRVISLQRSNLVPAI